MENIAFLIVTFILIGLVVGALGRMIVPTRRSGGWVASLLLGTFGAFSGGWVGGAIGMFRGGSQGGLLLSLLGAVILVALVQAAAVRRVET